MYMHVVYASDERNIHFVSASKINPRKSITQINLEVGQQMLVNHRLAFIAHCPNTHPETSASGTVRYGEKMEILRISPMNMQFGVIMGREGHPSEK